MPHEGLAGQVVSPGIPFTWNMNKVHPHALQLPGGLSGLTYQSHQNGIARLGPTGQEVHYQSTVSRNYQCTMRLHLEPTPQPHQAINYTLGFCGITSMLFCAIIPTATPDALPIAIPCYKTTSLFLLRGTCTTGTIKMQFQRPCNYI